MAAFMQAEMLLATNGFLLMQQLVGQNPETGENHASVQTYPYAIGARAGRLTWDIARGFRIAGTKPQTLIYFPTAPPLHSLIHPHSLYWSVDGYCLLFVTYFADIRFPSFWTAFASHYRRFVVR
jgi:hypothetical protein